MYLSSLPIPKELKQKIQRISLLKSSLFSARIEGNPLTLEAVNKGETDNEKNKEIFNILKANKYLEKTIKNKFKINKKFIYDLHSLVMFGELGKTKGFRNEMGAIFNQAGVAAYLSPPPTQVNGLVNQLIEYINSNVEKFPLICAIISHLVFEKIHPFVDGNGRVGRLLIFSILKAKGYGEVYLIAFEKYLDENKSDYYYYLDHGLKKTEDYLVFMLNSFLKESEELKKQIESAKNGKEKLLPPRQEEIYLIIKEHTIASFDNIRRRFLKVPERTLRYDLKKLVDKGLAIKIGQTKGSYYKISL
ncbi:MAG: Filamentation induced by cAMP protein Fic [Candidatus Roizmanbacteria bacterium GW2011_GWA2_33_33]|nr:MAG: Filamentation induced by cAMP protein Fic [Candidatus Roizmanbacteria bacterium GW2011_GWA2_33_33]